MTSLTPAEQRILGMLEPLRRHLQTSLASPLISKLPVDDLVQETYVRAVAAYDAAEFENDNMLFAWLKRIATNVSISAIRKKEPATSLLSQGSDMAQQIFDSGELTPSEVVSTEENRCLLSIAIKKLADHHQQVVRLRYHKQLSFEEIAREMNATASAVRGLHRNALDKLREILGDMTLYLSSR